jgi:hypothetical protein
MRRIILLAILAALLSALVTRAAAGHPTYTDAQKLASLASDLLLAPETLVARIDDDLAAIRAHAPEVSAIHAMCVTPMPGTVVVEMTPEALSDFVAGQHAEMNQLDEQLGMAMYWESTDLHLAVLFFALPYNPSRLAELYRPVSGVTSAYPEICGGDSPDQIVILSPGTYRFRHGWGDCPSMCTYETVWVFQVQDGVVTLVFQYTTDVTIPRMTWGKVKNLYR